MKIKILIFTILLSFVFVPKAYADVEPVEGILGTLEGLQKKAQNVQEKIKKAKTKINEVRQGVEGAIGEIDTALDNVEKIDDIQIQEVAGSIDDLSSLSTAFEENFTADPTNLDRTQESQKVKDLGDANLRNNVARMYAYGLTTRTNMQKTKEEKKEEDFKSDDMRKSLREANKEILVSARRLARIWDMQASLNELDLLSRLQVISNNGGGSDEE